MKKTAQQVVKQLRQEPQEIAKSALAQVSGQETKSSGSGKKGAGFKTQKKRIQKLSQQDRQQSEEKAVKIREQLGISASSEERPGEQTPQTAKKRPKAAAIASPYIRSLEQQVETLRQKVKREESVEKARQAREVEERKKKEELAKRELATPPSAPRKRVAPWARKIKASQGPGERRPSIGKQ